MKINFDALLTLLFLVVFFVLPLVSRVMRGRGRPPTGPGGVPQRPGGVPQRPGGVPQRPGGVPQRPGERSAQGAGVPPERPTGPVAGGGEDMPAWLREAQRRVSDAQAGGPARAGTPSAAPPRPPTLRTLVPEDPFERGLMERPLAGRPAGLGREGSGPAAGPGPRSAAPPAGPHARDSLGREGRPPRARRDITSTSRTPAVRRATAASRRGSPYALPSISARPRKVRGGATLGAGDLLRFDRRSVVRGLIWHEILDEPAWKRRHGRKPSRPRSR